MGQRKGIKKDIGLPRVSSLDHLRAGASSAPVDSVASKIFEHLAHRFPVCTTSDEFHFFPQPEPAGLNWSCWDDFSDSAVRETTVFLEKADRDLGRLGADDLSLDEKIDVSMLRSMIRTLTEQLTDVAVHKVQPTFYLTILGIGLAEGFEAGRESLTARLSGLPDFVDQALRNLKKIPRIFRNTGIEMIRGLVPWLKSITPAKSISDKALQSLDRLASHLKSVPVTEEFLLAQELYERVALYHMGCFAHTDDIANSLYQELSETESILRKTAEQIAPGKSWQEVLNTLPRPDLPPGGVREAYRRAVSDLEGHCRSIGLASPDFISSCPVRVESVPEYLMPVRGNAAYSMPPGYPPSGGTFFTIEQGKGTALAPDYRLLTAHETYPGHHLLDAHRWSHERPVRRHVEFPIFYEGWACFTEEILFDTGFFNSPIDCLLLAKRRFYRAIRGKLDLEIHTRKRNLDEAAGLLAAHGMDKDRAAGIVSRYILKPGYQLAYTIGRRRFRRLYDHWIGAGGSPVAFARRVLSTGEIGFDHLEQSLFKEVGCE